MACRGGVHPLRTLICGTFESFFSCVKSLKSSYAAFHTQEDEITCTLLQAMQKRSPRSVGPRNWEGATGLFDFQMNILCIAVTRSSVYVERHVMAHAWALPYFLAQKTAVEPVRPCHPCHDLRKSINPSSCEEKAPRRRA